MKRQQTYLRLLLFSQGQGTMPCFPFDARCAAEQPASSARMVTNSKTMTNRYLKKEKIYAFMSRNFLIYYYLKKNGLQ